jgi:(1->4)-alpha-D-glucan 1-alpha-D-glucosylmutase
VIATGSRAENVISFLRSDPDGQPVTATVAFRWPLLLRDGWGDTLVELPSGRWRDALTGGEAPGGEQRIATLLDAAPVALLERA